MIDTILFDMDGVLFDDKDIHFECLNIALGEKYAIPYELHLSVFNGLQTRKKLKILTDEYNLPENLHDYIWSVKQAETIKRLISLERDRRLCEMFDELHSSGYKLGVCSNSTRKTVLTVLSNLGIMKYLDIFFSNEDVLNPKPHPEIYWKAMSALHSIPETVLIIEDSPEGLKSAYSSGANVLKVKNPSEVTLNIISEKINSINQG
jgi:beta-phosphoglucomutase-like phosphatase (HAD superfamily)